MNTKAILVGIAVLVVIIAAVAIFGKYSSAPSSYYTSVAGQPTTVPSSGHQTPVLMTDPPIVPAGTSALVISYSSVKAHTEGASGSGWVSASGSGTINLLTLVNTSQVIGSANVSANSTIDMISFDVTSATITINGTTSNVTLTNPTITAHVVGETKVNATSGVLLDLSPTIATIYTSNSTVFVLVPSVKAIVVGSQQQVLGSSNIGAKETLNSSDKVRLEDASPNVSIVSSSMSVSGNTTSVSVTVKDNSNSSVVLGHVLVFGNYSVTVAQLSVNATVHIDNRGDVSQNGTAMLNLTDVGNGSGDMQVKTEGDANSTDHLSSEESAAVAEGISVQHTRVFNFMVDQNGSLSLPSVTSEAEVEGQNLGYNLSAGSTATFTFSGKLSFGGGHITITPTSGSQYRVVVSGKEDASASANVTAT